MSKKNMKYKNDNDIVNDNDNHNEFINELNEKELNKFNSDDKLIENFYYFINYLYNFLFWIITISSAYILWIFLHYFASHLYVKYCVPLSWSGFILSPLLTGTPHCQGLRWIIYNGANTINQMWVIVGTWICSKILLS
jgi:hypothetical protein